MTFNLEPNERLLVKRRKHWLVLLQQKIGAILAGLFPIVLGVIVFSAGILPVETGAVSLWIYATSAWLVIILMLLATIWTNYYLDVWIVTDRRIVHVDQVGLFNREVSSLHLDRIQDVTTNQQNIFESLFNFGTLRVQTAGALHEFTVMNGITRPTEVSQIIMEQMHRQKTSDDPRANELRDA